MIQMQYTGSQIEMLFKLHSDVLKILAGYSLGAACKNLRLARIIEASRSRRLSMVAIVLWGTAASADTFQNFEAGMVVGDVQFTVARYQDTLLSLAEEFNLGYEELVAANPGIDSWLPGEGSRVVLPKRLIIPKHASKGIYINLAEYRLYYFPEQKDADVLSFPISIGRGDWATPVGMTHIVSKLINPAWYPPQSIREEHAADGESLPAMVPPGPDNPLGRYALKLDLPGYLIHGTNKPYGIGMKVTHGCIRLHPEDMDVLFQRVAANTSVQIVWEPFKVGVEDGVIYLEAHSLRSEVEAILKIGEDMETGRKKNAYALTAAIRNVLQTLDVLGAEEIYQGTEIDWLRLIEIVRRGDGIPYPISARPTETEVAEKHAGPIEAVRETPRATTRFTTGKSTDYLF